MNTTPFPALSAETLLAVNTVGQWLAQNDFSGEQPYSSDCVVLAGNAVIPTIDAACRIAKAQGVPLLISGGIGHSTPFLYAVIARHPRYHTIRTSGRAEAAILADIANQFWHIPAEKIWLEDRSTNCGENARFSCALIRQAKENINTAIVVQDPTMHPANKAVRSFASHRVSAITSTTVRIPKSRLRERTAAMLSPHNIIQSCSNR